MYKINLIGLMFILLLSSSCSDSEDPIGKWDDNIKLSSKEFLFNSSENTARVTTEGEGWWISEVFMDGETYDIGDVDTTSKNFMMVEPDFTIERKNSRELIIVLFENQTNLVRTLTVGVQAGNYFDGIKITQSAD